MYSEAEPGVEGVPLSWDAINEVHAVFNNHSRILTHLSGVVRDLHQTLEDTRRMYNNAIKQRDEARAKLVIAQNNLASVGRIVSQYALVEDPVVASDGFTYERELIHDYLQECASTNTKAYSQLTKEELLDVLMPNQTLQRLVKMLQQMPAMDVPPVSQRSPIPPLIQQQPPDVTGAVTGGTLKWAGGEHNMSASPVRASELEATLVSAANATILNVSNSISPHCGVIANASNATARWDKQRQQHQQPPSLQQQQQQQPQQHQHQHQQGGGGGGYGNKNSNRKHPCLRVYGRCNFLDDCTFADYPYGACLNFIKGKCRFGQQCKELHVALQPRHQERGGGSTSNTPGSTDPSGAGQSDAQAWSNTVEEKEVSARGKRTTRERAKSSTAKGDLTVQSGDVETTDEVESKTGESHAESA